MRHALFETKNFKLRRVAQRLYTTVTYMTRNQLGYTSAIIQRTRLVLSYLSCRLLKAKTAKMRRNSKVERAKRGKTVQWFGSKTPREPRWQQGLEISCEGGRARTAITNSISEILVLL